ASDVGSVKNVSVRHPAEHINPYFPTRESGDIFFRHSVGRIGLNSVGNAGENGVRLISYRFHRRLIQSGNLVISPSNENRTSDSQSWSFPAVNDEQLYSGSLILFEWEKGHPVDTYPRTLFQARSGNRFIQYRFALLSAGGSVLRNL